MQVFLLLVVLLFAAPLILYAGPVFLYVVPFIVIGLAYSYLKEGTRHRTAAH